jgi:hypothetical protein
MQKKLTNLGEKTRKFGCYSFQKTYTPCVEQVHFQVHVYFSSSINRRYRSIYLRTPFPEQYFALFNGLSGCEKKDLIHDVTIK